MEDINNQLSLACSQCRTELIEDSIFCAECGFPEKGTEKEKSIFHAKRVMKKSRGQEAKSKIKNAANTLYIISGITIVFGIVFYMQDPDVAVLISNIVLGIIYLLLGFWSSKKPMIALLLGLLVYITTIVISAIVDPTTLYKGILWKVLIIAYLGKGLYSASALKKD